MLKNFQIVREGCNPKQLIHRIHTLEVYPFLLICFWTFFLLSTNMKSKSIKLCLIGRHCPLKHLLGPWFILKKKLYTLMTLWIRMYSSTCSCNLSVVSANKNLVTQKSEQSVEFEITSDPFLYIPNMQLIVEICW